MTPVIIICPKCGLVNHGKRKSCYLCLTPFGKTEVITEQARLFEYDNK